MKDPVQDRRHLLLWLASPALLSVPGWLIKTRRARADQTAPDDPRMTTGRVRVPNEAGGLQCYSARPITSSAKRGSVLIMHDILGLTPHFEDMARRFAIEGFAALAPDFASRYGGTPTERGPAMEVVGMATWPEMIADTHAALSWLRAQEDANGKVAAVGYGLGGSALGRVVMETNDLAAAVLLYGRVPPLAGVAAIKAPLLLIYAGDDPAIDADVPAFVEALHKAGLRPELVSYPGVKHGFDDDTTTSHYDQSAAALAWTRTLQFLQAHLV